LRGNLTWQFALLPQAATQHQGLSGGKMESAMPIFSIPARLMTMDQRPS